MNPLVTTSIHPTQEEAVATAIAECIREGNSGPVIVHAMSCAISKADEAACDCVPMTLQLGAKA